MLPDQRKIQMSFYQIGVLDHHHDLVAQLIDFLCTFTYNGVLLCVKDIIIALNIADPNHSLALVLDNLDIEAPFGDPADDPDELLVLMVLHKLDLHVFDGVAFGAGGQIFHIGGMFALLFVGFSIGGFTTV